MGVLLAVRWKQKNCHSYGRRRQRWFLKFGHPRPRHTQVLINWKSQQAKREHLSGICIRCCLARVVKFLSKNNHYNIFLPKESIKISFFSSLKSVVLSLLAHVSTVNILRITYIHTLEYIFMLIKKVSLLRLLFNLKYYPSSYPETTSRN